MRYNNNIIYELFDFYYCNTKYFNGNWRKFCKVKKNDQLFLECFTTGLLVVSGSMLLHEIKETSKTKIWGVSGFILSLLFIFLVSTRNNNSGVLSSLYFDSISDKPLLSALIPTFKNALPLVIPMTLEMFITAYIYIYF